MEVSCIQYREVLVLQLVTSLDCFASETKTLQSKTLKNLSAPKLSILNADSFIAVQQVGKP